ncbi:MAG: hypothetical protein JWL82_433 [Parcubacteria group bacterium]|nr:hypothetical protein [Parcubacteria group bacterium]
MNDLFQELVFGDNLNLSYDHYVEGWRTLIGQSQELIGFSLTELATATGMQQNTLEHVVRPPENRMRNPTPRTLLRIKRVFQDPAAARERLATIEVVAEKPTVRKRRAAKTESVRRSDAPRRLIFRKMPRWQIMREVPRHIRRHVFC